MGWGESLFFLFEIEEAAWRKLVLARDYRKPHSPPQPPPPQQEMDTQK